jgi:hypothetical protein
MSVVSVVCCQVEVSATSWSLVQMSPTDCGASCVWSRKPREWGGHSPRWDAAPNKKGLNMRNLSIKVYRTYVCYTNIKLYIAFGIIHGFT